MRALKDFHAWLRSLRFLDPACGSGNFLYVTLHTVKRIELEVMRTIEDVSKEYHIRFDEVGPWQFHGIEVKHWAREIAELTLWIGFHQFWRAHHDVQPEEPILRDTGTLEWRDAVLSSTDIVDDPTRAEADPTPRLLHPVTGRVVPDPTATRAYQVVRGASPATWPAADFIIGNPPYIGGTEMRETLGSGYVDALRAAYPDVPDGADFVMYWWSKAASAVERGETLRAGFITTNSITQVRNRRLVEDAETRGVRVTWAVADHPWVDDVDGAAVRVAMTVLAKDPAWATLVRVDEGAREVSSLNVSRLNADLTAHADVPTAAKTPLAANASLAFAGFQLFGAGFILEADEAAALLAADSRNAEIIKPYRNGRDLTGRPRGVYVIDFGLRTEAEARTWPALYDIVRDRVKPERDANRRASLARSWWRFGYPRGELRAALSGLPRYVATAETAKHRVFRFLDKSIAPDNMLTVVASDDAYVLGVLSSRIHITWALAAGGRLGDGNDPRYQKTLCFEPFPFPDASADLRSTIAEIVEQIEVLREAGLRSDASVTITGMYNVLEALRDGRPLTPAERRINTLRACGSLRDLHDRLDRHVAEAYGWQWPEPDAVLLERLVALHDLRVSEERSGRVRWVRPEYQLSRGGAEDTAEGVPALALALPDAPTGPRVEELSAWPSSVLEQIAALKVAALTPGTVDEFASRFRGARKDIIARHFEILALMGEVRQDAAGRFGAPIATL